MRTILVAACAIALAGCATSYQKTSFTGGFDELKLSENTYKVSVQGNGFTSKDRAEEIALLRAAELTIQNGYKRFVLVGGSGVSQQYAGSTDVVVSRIGNSLVASGGDAIVKPSGSLIIRMVRPNEPEYASALDAQIIDAQLRPKLVRS